MKWAWLKNGYGARSSAVARVAAETQDLTAAQRKERQATVDDALASGSAIASVRKEKLDKLTDGVRQKIEEFEGKTEGEQQKEQRKRTRQDRQSQRVAIDDELRALKAIFISKYGLDMVNKLLGEGTLGQGAVAFATNATDSLALALRNLRQSGRNLDMTAANTEYVVDEMIENAGHGSREDSPSRDSGDDVRLHNFGSARPPTPRNLFLWASSPLFASVPLPFRRTVRPRFGFLCDGPRQSVWTPKMRWEKVVRSLRDAS